MYRKSDPGRKPATKPATKKRTKGSVARPGTSAQRAARSLVGEFELMLQSIVEAFPNDPTGPGVSLAWVADKQQFYGSITRFRSRMAEGRYAVYKFYAESPVVVLTALIDAWMKHITPTSRNATEQLLKFKK